MKERPARPWDLFNKNIGRVTEELKQERLDICKACEHFNKPGPQLCGQCGCFMPAKASLPNAWCPVHKWEAVDLRNVEFNGEEPTTNNG